MCELSAVGWHINLALARLLDITTVKLLSVSLSKNHMINVYGTISETVLGINEVSQNTVKTS